MTCEEINKIKDILKSGDYDLACQLWIGGHPRTGNLEELACIIITENIFKFYKPVITCAGIDINDDVRIAVYYKPASTVTIELIRVIVKGDDIFSYKNNIESNIKTKRDLYQAAFIVALNYITYGVVRHFRLGDSYETINIVFKGLINQSELFNEPIKT